MRAHDLKEEKSPLLAGLAAVIQDDFLAVPAKPAGEGARAEQLVVQQDFPSLGIKVRGWGFFIQAARWLVCTKPGSISFPQTGQFIRLSLPWQP